MKETRRAAIYVRVSQNREDDRAKPDRQLFKCRQFAESKDLGVVDVYTDDDVSAYQGKKRRPEYERLLRDIERGEVDVVVSWHIDRMLRTTKEMLDFIDLANRTGASLESVQGGSLDLATPAGRMVAVILSAVAQAEVETKSERHVLRNQHAARKGMSTGGPVPFGWRDGTEATLLRAGMLSVLEGSSLGQIARDWNDAGSLTTFGKAWTGNSVRKVLARPRNAGLVEYRGEILWDVEASWEPICTVDEWRAVVNHSDGRRRAPRVRQHLLTNIVSCGKCGERMASATSARGKYRYQIYRCSRPTGCSVSVRLEALDGWVRRNVRHRLTFEDARTLAPTSRQMEEAIALRTERGRHTARLRELEELWASGDYSTASYRKHRAALTKEIEALDERLEVIEQDNAFAAMLAERVGVRDNPIRHAVEVGRRFDGLNLDQRRSIIKALFPKIEVSPAPRTGKRLSTEERVTLVLPNGEPYVTDGVWDDNEAA